MDDQITILTGHFSKYKPSIFSHFHPSVQLQGINDPPDGKSLPVGREIGGILVRDLLVGFASQQARGG